MKNIEDLPLVLNADDIAEILGISRISAYELMKETGFPVVRIGKRLKRVNRDSFFKWMEEQGEAKAQ